MIYLTFVVIPTFQEGVPSDLRNTHANCFVDSMDTGEAERIARFKIEQSGWKILSNGYLPTKVTLEDFEHKDIGTQAFKRASQSGLAIVYVGVSEKSGSANPNPERLAFTSDLNLEEYYELRKAIRLKGQCLYYETANCNEMIEAHSIQRSGVLSSIAVNNHVMVPSYNHSDLKKNNGRFTLRNHPTSKVSTFRGFCKKHDNEIFRPIDNQFLVPTSEQALLYAYRSLGREISVQKNALENYETQIRNDKLTSATRKLLTGMAVGTRKSLKNLMQQKEFFETSHRNRAYDDIQYVAFCARTEPSIVFSGCFYPATGFYHEKIQNLMTDNLDPLLFSYAPMENGWAFLFSWHKESKATAEAFLGSLANYERKSEQLEDLLFGMVLSHCENLAIAPLWIENMEAGQILRIEEAMSAGASPFSKCEMRNVIDNVKGITDWKFESVIDSRR